ncbi:unnamed protein product [Dimorphilus gyrociliatus]|uniref:Uncharacterized protein n=1 Tax=Dimorphilus gyrociliatus TaxID=2664684 RepID=A0A7I8VWH7_9ANNE|nr:unnamed protein product [Dimorphilus gyrociliatus]
MSESTNRESYLDNSPKKSSDRFRRSFLSGELEPTKERIQFLKTVQTLKTISVARKKAGKTLSNLAPDNLIPEDYVKPDQLGRQPIKPMSDKPYPTEEEALAAATDENGYLDKDRVVNHCLLVLSGVITELATLLPKVYQLRREVGVKKIKELDKLIEGLKMNP